MFLQSKIYKDAAFAGKLSVKEFDIKRPKNKDLFMCSCYSVWMSAPVFRQRQNIILTLYREKFQS